MNQTKLADEEIRSVIKIMKMIGSETAKQQCENQLRFLLLARDDLIRRKGEAWHQLALRSVEQGAYDEAEKRFAKAKSVIDATAQPLAYARTLRDEAWFATHHLGDLKRGQALASEAARCHDQDLAQARSRNAKSKGRRQGLITQTYVWRITYLAEGGNEPLTELLRVVEHEGRAFCDRDQLVIVEFLIPRVGVEERVKLQLRASQLKTARRSLVLLPYRTALRAATIGLSSARWLNRTIREG